VRHRLPLFIVTCLLALVATTAATAYPWPVKPFFKQHPIRANFGDPRTLFTLSFFDDGIEGPGEFSFHNGIDISAPDGTAVYPVMSGTVRNITPDEMVVDTGLGRSFQYYHLNSEVLDDTKVVAKKTVLGYIAKGWGHVHLGELRGTKIWNPLAKGGIAPYRDKTRPTVASIEFRKEDTLSTFDPLAVCGRIKIVTEAYDTPQVKVPGSFANFPVAPALVTWTLRRVGTGEVIAGPVNVADFRGTLPLNGDFWNVYARGTYQNAPRFGPRQFGLMPGRLIYNLTPAGLDTRTLTNGVYQVTVRAADIKDNAGSLSQRFTVFNQTGSLTGCPAAPRPRP
jgi:murein DD-endopeptidase MepM/ murein hydrolase activator NlpD